MTLPDGVRVESGFRTSEETASGLGINAYRLRGPDGWTREFSCMKTVFDYLREHYNLEEYEGSAPDDLPGSDELQTAPAGFLPTSSDTSVQCAVQLGDAACETALEENS